MTRRAYLTLEHGSQPLGTLHLDLYDESVPKTVENFCALLQRPAGKGFLTSRFHRIIRGFMAQGGDYTNGDGTGGESIYGAEFADENFLHRHDKRGTLSMANAGRNTNGSQFFVTFRPTSHLDGKHVVFGRVDLEQSASVLDKLEAVQTDSGDKPLEPITVVACGVVQDDEDEIDIEDAELEPVAKAAPPEAAPQEPVEEEEEVVSDDDIPRTKSEALKHRLRKLKQKMNQARQLNRQAVQKEGERLTGNKERKRLAAVDKKNKQAALESRHAKAMETAQEAGVDGKYLVEQAVDSVQRTVKQAEKDELNRFEVNDYYNPEGQHRNYQRGLKSLPTYTASSDNATSTDTFNPLQDAADPEQERQGARRLAQELQRRMEKSQARKRKQEEKQTDGDDVSYINQRNKRFNAKINRTYDKATAEIRQNLERGTAL